MDQSVHRRYRLLEAYISNLATLSRYFGHDLSGPRPRDSQTASFSVEDLIARARAGDAKALAALNSTSRVISAWDWASIINALDPREFLSAVKITTAWSLIEPIVRKRIARTNVN
jgi:predicted NBD/HSP70 family sugar kinase